MSMLIARREAMKLTQAALAAKIGISAGQLSRIERNGKTSLDTAITIERVTGVWVGRLANASARDARAVARVIGGRSA